MNNQKYISGSEEELCILFDFSCGRFYTHHSSYLKDYYDFLVLRNSHTKVWVNTSADQKVLELFGNNVSAILRSNYYSHTRRDNFRLFLTDYIVNYFVDIKIPNCIRSWLSSLYLSGAIKELKKYIKSGNKIKLVVPTLDGLGMRLVIKSLELYSDNISLISFRVTGAERRGIFGFENSLEVFKEICDSYPEKINIGYEVNAYGVKLRNYGVPERNIYWAPMPYISRRYESTIKKLQVDSPIKLGFLGSARPNKGFDYIPKILDSLKNLQVNFLAFIQLPEFEWYEFKFTYDELMKNHSKSIRLIDGGISKDALDKTINDVDLVVLPYKLENYQLAGSGILFLAADFKVPIAATKDLAFGWDIEVFNLGFLFEDAIDFSSKLKLFLDKSFDLNLEQYNFNRIDANLKFLRIT
jgi:glycosyltransferase involved in cell wall biosynthesis